MHGVPTDRVIDDKVPKQYEDIPRYSSPVELGADYAVILGLSRRSASAVSTIAHGTKTGVTKDEGSTQISMIERPVQ